MGVWPGSTRTQRVRVDRQAGHFWDLVQETHSIDLRHFGLRECEEVEFTFVDPIWAWIQQCNKLYAAGHKLQFDPKILKNENGQHMYGAGIQFGKLFHHAVKNVPRSGKVALFNISWDGGDTIYKARSVCPIYAQVMNTNGSSPLNIGDVGYLPKIEVSDARAKTPAFKNAMHYLLQVQINYGKHASFLYKHVQKTCLACSVLKPRMRVCV
jgi:hypothetical protein